MVDFYLKTRFSGLRHPISPGRILLLAHLTFWNALEREIYEKNKNDIFYSIKYL